MAEHLSYHDERMNLTTDMAEPYFGSTYVDGLIDRQVKPFLNEVVRRSIPLRCANTPNPRKIAVISDLWARTHSVYRTLYAYLASLKGHFHLTLFHCLRHEDIETSLFDEVHRLEFRDLSLDVTPLQSNDFMVAYFPDVGMTLPSIMLANCRIAPIQACSVGHSVSTWGADIDYYISGQDVEVADEPQRNYSERLLLLPGMGVIHNRPLYERTNRQKKVSEIVINFSASGQKLNARMLRTLGKLLKQVHRPVRFRFFPAVLDIQNGYLPFLAEVCAALSGTSAVLEIMPSLRYADYMGLMEEGDLALDCFHFAGCNTVADSLSLGKPTVVWEGDKWYNRIGASMLRLAGLEELIGRSEEEYLEKALRLIHDDQWRESLTAKLQAADLDATVFSDAAGESFRRAMEFLISNHERLKSEPSRKPIRIL